jgi:allophanate hydrolase subunit 2
MYRWIDPQGYIRVLEGPEYDYLTDKTLFTNSYWVISNDFSDMGFRLLTRGRLPEVNLKNMISEAVADGTVQLTPKGPIVLLKQRQTVGGYPRIYNVISADVDLLAQYSPNQILHFSKVTLDQAFAIACEKESTLTRLS